LIVYLDASAIVKRYVVESGSAEVESLVRDARTVGTGMLSRAEVAAALAKAARLRLLSRDSAMAALTLFGAHWPHLVRLQFGEGLAARAASLAWEHDLRGYDAVHLATALAWQETLGETVVLATFDRELWRSAPAAGLSAWPLRIV
jgi:predicted nucleic acid-binding protein